MKRKSAPASAAPAGVRAMSAAERKRLRVQELRDALGELGEDTTGTKPVLLQRLEAALEAKRAEEEEDGAGAGPTEAAAEGRGRGGPAEEQEEQEEQEEEGVTYSLYGPYMDPIRSVAFWLHRAFWSFQASNRGSS